MSSSPASTNTAVIDPPVVQAPASKGPGSTICPTGHNLRELRQLICDRVAVDLRRDGQMPQDEITKIEIRRRTNEFLQSARTGLDEATRVAVLKEVMDELFGFGPIQPLLDDPTVTEIMVNRADRVYAERKGRSERTDIVFDDDAHVRRTIEKIIAPLGRRLDDEYPLVDARLPDGSRVNACAKPVRDRRLQHHDPKVSDDATDDRRPRQVRRAVAARSAEFLNACVVSRMNIVVAGGTGSGKTTLLNVLSQFIPGHERIVTIEDAAELKLGQDQVVRLESKKSERGRQRRGDDPRPGSQRPADATRTGSSSASAAAARRWTCSRR